MSRCPLCRGTLTRHNRGRASFLVCPPCQLALLSEEELATQGARLHSHATPSSRRCPSCGGEQLDRTVIMAHGLVDASHCRSCRLVTFSLPELLASFSKGRRPRPIPDAREPARTRRGSPQIDERDRILAFLLALPLELSEKRDTVPVGVAILVLACTVAFVFDVMSGGALGADLAFSTTHGPLHMGLGLLTSALAHVDPIHLLGNMYFLYAFGRLLERRTGTEVILPLFASSAILASLAFWAVHLGQDAALEGASGAVSGILGCYLALFPARRVGVSLFFYVLKVPAALYLGWWLVVQLVSVPVEQGVAYSAHAGGFLAGLIWGLVIRRTGEYEAE